MVCEFLYIKIGYKLQLFKILFMPGSTRANRNIKQLMLGLHSEASAGHQLSLAGGVPQDRLQRFVVQIAGLAETRIVGQRIAWEEHPFEWIEGRRMSVLRRFSKGPFAWFVSVVELAPQADGSTVLRHRIQLEPRNMLGRMIGKMEIGMKARRSLTRIYQQIDGYIASGKASDPTADALSCESFVLCGN